MKLYSDFAGQRTAQVLSDVISLALIAAAVWLGTIVYAAIAVLAIFGKTIEDAGDGFKKTMADAGDTLGGVPIIGPGIRSPFEAASNAGQLLATAGQAQQDVVLTAATVLGIVTAAIPILIVLVIWLPRRIRFARRAGEAVAMARLADGPDLLALRAMMTANSKTLRAIDREPVDAWRRGDKRVMRELAQLELTGAGVKLR